MQLTELPAVSAPLPWQGEAWSRLTEQFAEGRLPHALLLAGEEGTGKSQLALALARMLLCAAPRDGLGCGECPACEYSASGVHGDFRWLQPEGDSRVIKVDQVRELVGFLNQTAGFGQRKVAVLAPADTMNVAAYNALLKSLEEPAGDTVVILVCHRVHNVLATIRSRCQMLRLATPSEASSLAWLDGLTGDNAASRALLQLSDGKPMLAERLYLNGGAEELQARRAVVRALLEGRADPVSVTGLWQDIGVDAFLDQVTADLQQELSTLDGDGLRRAGPAGFGLLDELSGLRRAVAGGSNPNRELLLETILSKVQRQLGPLLTR